MHMKDTKNTNNVETTEDTKRIKTTENIGKTEGVHFFISELITAGDPNAKHGPRGPVSAGQKLDYKVEFENTGGGKAFGVYFTDTLDEDLDDSTLEIGQVKDVKDDSVIAPAGTYDPKTRTITWLVGEVGPGNGWICKPERECEERRAKGQRGHQLCHRLLPQRP